MDTILNTKKIILLGCSGSGKSTFARKLHNLTGLPLIHLDNVWWKPDRTHITRDAFDRELDRILQGDAWIIDGDYSRTYEVRLRACETVFFLDFSEEQCLNGITERIGKERPDIPWTESTLDPELIRLVKAYRTENRPKLFELFQKYPEKKIIVFRSRPEADHWIESGYPTAFPAKDPVQ